jgi:hypothetical protein
MKIANLFSLAFLILFLLCSTVLNKNKLKTKQTCAGLNPNYYIFNDRWTLNNGYGEISFQGKGRDGYIRIHNQSNDSSHQYWIVIAGWDNTKTRITRGDGSTICEIPQTLDLGKTYNYRIILNPSASRIKLLLDDNEAWTCVDKNGWYGPSAKYFSLSKWCCADMSMCNVASNVLSEQANTCFIPDPTRFTFNNEWVFPSQQGSILFNGYGNDLYIRLNNQQDSSSYQYWIVMGGWSNTTSKVFRGDGSVICSFNQTIDLNKTANYEVAFNKNTNSIELFANGSKLWTCVDSNGWNAPDAKWVSISRYSGAFYEICNVWTVMAMSANRTAHDPDAQLSLTKTAR